MDSESTWIVNLDLVRSNLRSMERFTKRKILAVVKADAYGLGAKAVARKLASDVDGFCVATVSEAKELVESGANRDRPVLVFGYVDPLDMRWMVEHAVRPALSTLEDARRWDHMARQVGVCAPIHIALDTGHRRIGFWAEDPSTIRNLVEISHLPNLQWEGMYTHLATADESNEAPSDAFPNLFALSQLRSFKKTAQALENAGITIPIRHLGNDAAVLTFDDAELFEAVRLGICLYGQPPSRALEQSVEADLKIPYCWTAPVSRIKWIEKGETVSYGRTWTAPRRTKVATAQVGYADGYPRVLSNRGMMRVEGVTCPVIGRVCMDQVMIDVTKAPDFPVGTRVIVMGSPDGDPSHGISADTLAEKAGTISYEMLTNRHARVGVKYLGEEEGGDDESQCDRWHQLGR